MEHTPEKAHVQPQPIVYSFGQSDYNNKYLPVFNSVSGHHSRTVPNKKITWSFETNLEYEDDFADILGWVFINWE